MDKMKALLRLILKGLVVVIPIGATIYVLWWLGSGIESLLSAILQPLLPEKGPMQYRTGMGVLLALVALLAVGLLTYSFLFRKLVGWIEALMKRIPLAKSIYGGVRDLMDFMSKSQEDHSQMDQVVSIELAGGIRMLGFITQSETQSIPGPLKDDGRVGVYLPMSYQLGGFTVFVQPDQLTKVDMTIEDAMRYALTAGMGSQKPADPQETLASGMNARGKSPRQDERKETG